MPSCMYMVTEKWMKENYGKSVKGCLYYEGHCQYWKQCAVEWRVDWFLSPHLSALFQLSKDDILAMRKEKERASKLEEKRKRLRKETRIYTYRKRKTKRRELKD